MHKSKNNGKNVVGFRKTIKMKLSSGIFIKKVIDCRIISEFLFSISDFRITNIFRNKHIVIQNYRCSLNYSNLESRVSVWNSSNLEKKKTMTRTSSCQGKG